MNKYMDETSRVFFDRWLSFAVEVFLGLYIILDITLYPSSRHYCDNLATAALFCGLVRLIIRPPKHKPIWPNWAFVIGIIAFYLINFVAVELAEEIPGIGHSGSRLQHLPGLLLAMATGIGLKNRQSAGRILKVILIVAGVYYMGQLISLLWRSPYMDGRFIGSRNYHILIAEELLLLFSLYLAFVALSTKLWLRMFSFLGAVLIGTLIFMTKTRFALLTMVFVTVPSVLVIQNSFAVIRRHRLICVLAWIIIIGPTAGVIWYKIAGPERRSLAHASSRIAAWEISFKILKKENWQRRIIGHGRFSKAAFFALAEHYNIDQSGLYGEKFPHAHNTIIQTFLETGILGTAFLILIWASAFYRALSAWLRPRGEIAVVSGVMVIALITMAVMAQLDYLLWKFPELLSFFLVGLAFASGDNEE